MTQKLVESFQGLFDSVVAAAPTVVMAIVLVIVALIVAKVAEKLLRMILVRVKFDSLIGKAGVDKALHRIGLRQELSRFIPRLVYFLLLVLLAKTASDVLGLVAVSDALTSFFSYLPSLLSAVILILLGSTIGPVVGQTVERAAESSGMEFGRALGRMVSGLILFIVGLMALAQLKIDTEIIRLVTAFCLAGFALAFGLSFGLGTRDVTRNIVAGYYARKTLRVGQTLEVRGQQGILKAVTPTHTLIEKDRRTVSIANGTFLDEVAEQRDESA